MKPDLNPRNLCGYGAGKNLKPYQGLKPEFYILQNICLPCRKKPKTLSGIETFSISSSSCLFLAGKNLKPYQGLKHQSRFDVYIAYGAGKNLKPYQGLKPARRLEADAESALSRKKPKTLSGIETSTLLFSNADIYRRKKPKTLSGIETPTSTSDKPLPSIAGKNLKPYQGLKPKINGL